MNIQKAKEIMHEVYTSFYPQLMCSDVCKVFMMIMEQHGLETRHLALTRPSTDPLQGHSACEIKFDDWILFDVAFDWCPEVSAEKADIKKHAYLKEHPQYLEEFIELYRNIEYVNR